jgi:hypothetical protein
VRRTFKGKENEEGKVVACLRRVADVIEEAEVIIRPFVI